MTTTINTQSLHRKLMILLKQNGYSSDDRHDLVYRLTNGRTQSTMGLYFREMIDLCNWLEQNSKSATDELLLRKKRAVVLKIAQRTGIHDPEDWSKFNNFMLKRSILKKPLKNYKYKELNKLIQQFRQLEQNYLKSAEKPFNKAWWNEGRKRAHLN